MSQTAAPHPHTIALCGWAIGAAVCVHIAANPVYTTIVLLVAVIIVEVHRSATLVAKAFPIIVFISAIFALLRVALTALTTHGVGRAWFTLPELFTLPRWLGSIRIGGRVELATVLHSMTEAYAIVGFIAVFAAWNATVSHHEVLRMVPRALHDAALVVAIAVAFVPSAVNSFNAIREAERARTGGRAVRRGRLRRTVIPVVESAMERAILLSESMDSRGYGHQAVGDGERLVAWLCTGGLAAVGVAFVAFVSRAEFVATVAGVLGIAAVAAAITIASRQSDRTRYRPVPMQRFDYVIVACSFASVATVAVIASASDASMQWSPNRFEFPPVNPLVVFALVLLLAPVSISLPSHGKSSRQTALPGATP